MQSSPDVLHSDGRGGLTPAAHGAAPVNRVVGAAIVDSGRVLSARRTEPPRLAGKWEFPGGKVEAGESDVVALVRECREELDVAVSVGALLAEVPLAADWVLAIYRCALAGTAPSTSTDHDRLRWLSAEEFTEVDWLPADRPVLARVARLLTPRASEP